MLDDLQDSSAKCWIEAASDSERKGWILSDLIGVKNCWK